MPTARHFFRRQGGQWLRVFEVIAQLSPVWQGAYGLALEILRRKNPLQASHVFTPTDTNVWIRKNDDGISVNKDSHLLVAYCQGSKGPGRSGSP